MKPRLRIRKTVQWTSAVMVVVLMVAWAVSLSWQTKYIGADWAIGTFGQGLFFRWGSTGWSPVLSESGWMVERASHTWHDGLRFDWLSGRSLADGTPFFGLIVPI